MSAGPPADADPLEVAWAKVEAEWDSREAHGAFQALASELGRLPEAGRRYRDVRERDAERADAAREQIDKLHALALAKLPALRGPKVTKRHPAFVLLACVVGGGIIGMALWTLLRGG